MSDSCSIQLCPGECDFCHCSGLVSFGSLYTQWKQTVSVSWYSTVAIPQRKGSWKNEEKGLWAWSHLMLSNILVLWTLTVLSCLFGEIHWCINVETFGGKKCLVVCFFYLLFLPAFKGLFSSWFFFFICAINLFYWSVCTDSSKLHIIVIIISICFFLKRKPHQSCCDENKL